MATWTNPITWTATIWTVAQGNTYVRDNQMYLKAFLHPDATSEVTIAGGAVTITRTYHRVDTQADAASDDLDSIAGGSEGVIVILRAENAARTVVLKHLTGNLDLGGVDISLTDADQHAMLIYGADTNWHIIAPPDKHYTDIVCVGNEVVCVGNNVVYV